MEKLVDACNMLSKSKKMDFAYKITAHIEHEPAVPVEFGNMVAGLVV